jgi:pimeloyl-ACP methyl ester carboxylesterase
MPPTERWITIDNDHIHYQLIGKFSSEQPFILFLHEGLGSIPQWKDFPGLLCESTSLPGLVYERPGYGRSTPATSARADDFLKREGEELLPKLLQKLNLRGNHVVFGHSDGGTIALYYASKNPAALKLAVVEAPHVYLEELSRKAIYRTQQAFLNGRLKEALDKYHAPHTENVVMSWTRYWLHPDNKGWNMFKELTSIAKPLVFIQGDNDTFGTREQARIIERSIQGPFSKLFLEKCGHVPHHEKQEELLDYLPPVIHKHL